MKKFVFSLAFLILFLFPVFVFAGTLRVYFLDVGQGDSTIIISSTGEVVMIDSGPDEDIIFNHLKEIGINHIDLLIASHPHADHISGMDKIVDIYKPRAFMDPGIPHTTTSYENLLFTLKENNTKYYQATARKIKLGPLLFTVFPPADPSIEESSLNNNSAVIRLDHGDISFLFPGDIEKERENQLIQIAKDQLDTDILKVPHHGSSTGTTIAFLQATTPDVGVIFCGKGNNYGHPHLETLEALQDCGIQVYRTDINGTILIETDGKTYKIIPEKGESRGPPTLKWEELRKQLEAEGIIPSSTVKPTESPTPSTLSPAIEEPTVAYKYVASKNSDVFHYVWCSYVQRIKPENRIYFSTREEAIASERRPCKRCKP